MTREEFFADVAKYVESPVTLEQEERFLRELDKIDPLKNKCIFLREDTIKKIKELKNEH